jgi:hypothetical protein
MNTADVIWLADRRPKAAAFPDPPANPEEWKLIDELCDDLALCENVEGQVRAGLASLLLACLDADVGAIAQTYWYFVRCNILAPLDAFKAGEPWYAAAIDKLRGIDQLVTEFFRNVDRDYPRYRPLTGAGA